MKVIDLLECRRQAWQELERLLSQLDRPRVRRADAEAVLRLGALYRAACADLALAEAYNLPEDTIDYLHHLVGRAHHLIYRSRGFRWDLWGHELFTEVPRRLYADRFVRLAFILFWGFFLASAFVSAADDRFAQRIVGTATLHEFETMYSAPVHDRASGMPTAMAGFYIQHNISIGLQCFAWGLVLFGLGSIYVLCSNAIPLGAVFGHMAMTAQAGNFFEFVTAHGPFELTAVVLSAAAGMRMGFAVVDPRGATRLDALVCEARHAVPIMGAAAVLFGLAAFIEGLVSPSALPYGFKLAVAGVSTVLLVLYLVVVGRPPRSHRAA